MRTYGIVTDVKDLIFGSLVVITRHLKATDNVEVKILKSTSPEALLEGAYDYLKRDSITEIDWSFVEEFYNRYHSCGEIAHNDDLQRVHDGEWEEGDHVHKLLMSEYKGLEEHPQIIIDLELSYDKIYSYAWECKFCEH